LHDIYCGIILYANQLINVLDFTPQNLFIKIHKLLEKKKTIFSIHW